MDENPIHILIVEDEDRLRAGLMRAVPAMGFISVKDASSAEDALNVMEEQPCEVVLLDLNLPGMNGIHCFEKIRECWPKTQVIIVTGHGDFDSAKQAVHLDAVEFLTKPVTLTVLEQAIGRACQRLYDARRLQPVITVEGSEKPETTRLNDSETDSNMPVSLQQLETQHILAALERNDGNRTAAAAELGISRRTLHYRIREFQRIGLLPVD